MSKIERGIPPEVDLSVDPAVIELAESLLQTKPDLERSAKWIQSPEKLAREKLWAGVLYKTLYPFLFFSCKGVEVFDGPPVFHEITVAFLGPNDTLIKPTRISKVRSLTVEAGHQEIGPFEGTVFRGGRRRAEEEPVDPRVHSWVGRAIRKTGLDEIPQLKAAAEGKMAFIGPRGYTPEELRDLRIAFEDPVLSQGITVNDPLLKEGLLNYQEIMARAAPRPGIAGLYAAILKKDLTFVERLLLDEYYCLCATPIGDIRIVIATMKSTLKMTGAR